MSKEKTAKRALLMSGLALLLCFSMLVGSTFAWFADDATSASNKIQSGTLLLDLKLLDKDTQKWNSIKKSEAPIFNYDLWEPGYTDVKVLKIENEGTLALKWQARFVSDKALSALADVIDVYVKPSADALAYPADRNLEGYTKAGTVREFVNTLEDTTKGVLAAKESAYLGIALKMQETAGNEYQGLDLGTFDITILATQASVESDNFGADYDADIPLVKVVDSGAMGGVDWTLTDDGTLTISPAQGEVTKKKPDSQELYKAGEWAAAVNDAATGYEWPYNKYKSQIKQLVIEEGVTSIGSFVLDGIGTLSGEVVIPSTVTYLGQQALRNCSITKLTFAKGGKEKLCIAPSALGGLAVEEIVLPADRPEIHIHCWAFTNCKKLQRITFPANVTTFSCWTHVDYYGMENYYPKEPEASDSQVLSGCTSLKSITFGSQEVRDLFFNSPRNTNNINAIGNVEIIVKK